jgi:hypothetical protein
MHKEGPELAKRRRLPHSITIFLELLSPTSVYYHNEKKRQFLLNLHLQRIPFAKQPTVVDSCLY